MLPYIALAVSGLGVLIAGIILITRKKKTAGIILTVVGALAGLMGAFLIACTLILVDFIHNQPPKEPPVTAEAAVTEWISGEG